MRTQAYPSFPKITHAYPRFSMRTHAYTRFLMNFHEIIRKRTAQSSGSPSEKEVAGAFFNQKNEGTPKGNNAEWAKTVREGRKS